MHRQLLIHIGVYETKTDYIFSVNDNGIGIAPEYREKIFALFQRLHTTLEYPGTGVGLALCKKIIERHQGHIWAESNEGEGITIKFSLPKEKSEE